MGVDWAYLSLLTWSHVDSGMHDVVVIVVYYVVVLCVSKYFCFARSPGPLRDASRCSLVLLVLILRMV